MKSITGKLRRLITGAVLFTAIVLLTSRFDAAIIECVLTEPAVTYLYTLAPQGKLVGKVKVTAGAGSAKIKKGYSKEFKHDLLKITPKKPGKITVKYTCRKNGKNKNYTKSFLIVDHVNPVETLTIGTTDFTRNFDTANLVKVTGNVSGILSVVPAEEWEISSISFVSKNGNGRQVKSGKKVTLSKGTYLRLCMKKGDEFRYITLNNNGRFYNYLEQQGG